jgi:hypothetical protein
MHPIQVMCSITWLIIAVLVSGCTRSNYPQTVPVNGTVTLDGQPVPRAVVTFLPTSGNRSATGDTDELGRFALSTFSPGDGAVVGEHRVAIVPKDPPPMPGSQFAVSGSASKTPWKAPFPAKYGQPAKSGFTVTVADGRKNTFAFAMESR